MLSRKSRWFSFGKKKPVRNTPKLQKKSRLALELLEDRVTPTTIAQWAFNSSTVAPINTQNGSTGNTVNQFTAGATGGPTTGSGSLDTLGMWEATLAIPEQVERAAAQELDFTRLPAHDEIENVVVLGMGGSGIVGDVLLSVAGPFMATPVMVCKSYEPPSLAGPTTLCIALSYSGDTEETVEAAQTAALAGAQMVVVAGGGELTRLGLRKNHLELAMGDPAVAANFVEMRRVTSELADVELALAAAEDAWLELEELAP